MATKKANKNVNSKTPTAILQKNLLYISFGLPLRPKLHFKIQIPTGLLKGSNFVVCLRLNFIFVICLVYWIGFNVQPRVFDRGGHLWCNADPHFLYY